MIDFSKFEKKTKVSFKDKNLLKQAFVHRSYLNENPKLGIDHNERLEFLGDAVLELSVTDYLYKKYPDSTEGDLTSYRASLVNSDTISEAAAKLGMNEYLLLSKGEAKDVGKARQYILANVFESFIGAIYLDQGYDAADKFIASCLFGKIDTIIKKGLFKDAKSLIQEKAQEHAGVTPAYKIIKEFGPDHDKMFTVGVYFGDELVAEGSGKSKQEAEQKAAKAALSKKRWGK
ncbi:MAG: ribonuclease III [Patescibacteria group bacterium]